MNTFEDSIRVKGRAPFYMFSHDNDVSRNLIACGVPTNKCCGNAINKGTMVIADGREFIIATKAHNTPKEAYQCFIKSLVKMGWEYNPQSKTIMNGKRKDDYPVDMGEPENFGAAI